MKEIVKWQSVKDGKPMKNVTVACRTMLGPREENQDRGYADASESGTWVIGVADGLGGHIRGDKAAEAAINLLQPEMLGESALADLFTSANAEVEKLAEDDGNGFINWRLIPMSTLCVAAFQPVQPDSVLIGWSGDTMAYRLRISDDVIVAERIGQTHNNADGTISHCLGFGAYFDTVTVDVADIFGVAVCSDGVWEPLASITPKRYADRYFKVPFKTLEQAEGEYQLNADRVCSLILGEAEHVGLRDNATIAVASW